ncbi:ketopantoate reductase family protein [Paenibacillus macerans]|uniref:ketopantoate reductase family protein n=1 Tax=Paenibacillus macerans TaxID=44252 RepID=UPI003D320B9F
MNIEIIGAGALGLLFGGKLAAAGERVRFWTRTPEQAALLKTQGISLTEADGRSRFIEGICFDTAYMEENGELERKSEAEWLLITTKQRHIDDNLLSFLRGLAGRQTKAVCFQNGVGHLNRVQQALPERLVFAAITTEGAKRTDGRSVIHAGFGETNIGIYWNRNQSGKVVQETETEASRLTGESLVKMLGTAGFAAFLSKDIDREIYRKLLINAVINPLTALWRVDNGQLLENAERKALLRQLCDEGISIYRAHGIPCDEDMYDQIVAICRATSTNVSSMLKDVQQGTPTEIDFINGRLVEMASAKGLSAPGHELVWRLVRAL